MSVSPGGPGLETKPVTTECNGPVIQTSVIITIYRFVKTSSPPYTLQISSTQIYADCNSSLIIATIHPTGPMLIRVCPSQNFQKIQISKKDLGCGLVTRKKIKLR